MKSGVFSAAIVALVLFVSSTAVASSKSGSEPKEMAPTTFRLFTLSVIRRSPDGKIVDVWDRGTMFTSNLYEGPWLRVTGYFPDGRWEKAPEDWWVLRAYSQEVDNGGDAPGTTTLGDHYVIVDKSDFKLEVFQQDVGGDRRLFSTRVAIGMDRCLPESKGGRCYYTEPGKYKIRWKIHDPHGIKWCIPPSMEKQYARDIATGHRCFRGPLGYYALNIGKSYAIHGTNHPELLGKKVSHGCIRAANRAMKKLYRLLDEGDPVYIRE